MQKGNICKKKNEKQTFKKIDERTNNNNKAKKWQRINDREHYSPKQNKNKNTCTP